MTETRHRVHAEFDLLLSSDQLRAVRRHLIGLGALPGGTESLNERRAHLLALLTANVSSTGDDARPATLVGIGASLVAGSQET